MGAADEWPAARKLLRQRVARRHGRRHAGLVRRLFWHHGRPGVWLTRRRRQLGTPRPRPAGGAVSGGADAEVTHSPARSASKGSMIGPLLALRAGRNLNNDFVSAAT